MPILTRFSSGTTHRTARSLVIFAPQAPGWDGGGTYSGSITDPAKDKTYSGSGTLSGGSLKMKGCVLGGLICRSQTWTKL